MCSHQILQGYVLVLIVILLAVDGYVPANLIRQNRFGLDRRTTRCLQAADENASEGESDISRTLQRAKDILAKSKAKLAAMEKEAALKEEAESNETPADNIETQTPIAASNNNTAAATPFFATTVNNSRRNQVIKSTDNITGLITTDGEAMAKLSEQEQWQARKISDVFVSEVKEPDLTTTIMERDIAASIRSMRAEMAMEDYKRIFDPRNRFIGEDN